MVRTSVTLLACRSLRTSSFSPRFDVICALSEYIRTAKWNLFVKLFFATRSGFKYMKLLSSIGKSATYADTVLVIHL